MPASTASPAAPATTPANPARLVCAQVWGGNQPIDTPILLPGMRGQVLSQPSDGGRGGDVYYLSICGSGLLSRICIADVAGHGQNVARVGTEMHGLLKRLANRLDQRRFLRLLNRWLVRVGLESMTTAAVLTYYPPSRRLSYSYAGHPPGWIISSRTGACRRLDLERGDTARFVNGALGVMDDASFTRGHTRIERGDRLVLVTDGILEAANGDGEQFGADRVSGALRAAGDEPPESLATRLVAAVTEHAGAPLTHDDVTVLVLEFDEGPGGPALWHVVRNRLLRKIGLVTDDAERDTSSGERGDAATQ